MKVIIVEGPDNCGKSLLISSLLEKFTTATVIHCGAPNFKTDELPYLYQLYVQSINENKFNTNVVIFNRSWIGEYVYGSLYRNKFPHDIEKMILRLEKELSEHNEIFYVQLMSSNIDLLLKNDDGLSLSNQSKDKIKIELEMFQEIFTKSSIKNKKMIYVNNEDTFRQLTDIKNELFNFLQLNDSKS